MDPDRVVPGNTVSVLGRNFGAQGRLEIDGIAINRGYIRSWNENLVVFELPRDVRSGMVRVQTDSGMSNPLFLTNQTDLPRIISDERVFVRTVSRRTAAPGVVVTVNGEGFGPRTSRSRFGFHFTDTGDERVVPGDSWWIIRWTNRQVQFVVPADLPSGPVDLVVNGARLPMDFVIQAPTGTVSLGEPRSYSVDHAVRVIVPTENRPATDNLRVLLSRVPLIPAQPTKDLIEERGSRTGEDTPAAWVYRLMPEDRAEDAPEDSPWKYLASRTVQVERRTVRWEVQSTLPTASVLEPEFQRAFRLFLSDHDGVPLFDSAVSEIRRSAINLRNTLPVIARTIHREVQRRLSPDPGGTADLAEALAGEPASARAYADLATALLRQSGIPARRNFGLILADDDDSRAHVWVELFLPGVGWIPMDPAVGDGMFGEDYSEVTAFYGDDLATGTFGALDDRRLTTHIDGIPDPSLFTRARYRRPTSTDADLPVTRLEAPDDTVFDLIEIIWPGPHVSPGRRAN